MVVAGGLLPARCRHLAGICERGGVRGEEGRQHDEEIDKRRATDSGLPEHQR